MKKLIFILVINFIFYPDQVISQFRCCNCLQIQVDDLFNSPHSVGVEVIDSCNDRKLFHFGEMKRVIQLEDSTLNISLYPYNPITRKEDYLLTLAIACSNQEYKLILDSMAREPLYFRGMNEYILDSTNADILGYYFCYKLLETRHSSWLGQIQSAYNELPADGSFFYLLDILRDMHILGFNRYDKLFLSDAGDEVLYVKKCAGYE